MDSASQPDQSYPPEKDKVIAESGDEAGVNEESNRVIGMEDKGIVESGDAVGVKDDLNRVVGMEKDKGIVESGDEVGVKDDLKREIGVLKREESWVSVAQGKR